MAYYLLQHRRLVQTHAGQLSFPAKLILRIRFGPDDAFGVSGSPGQVRTTAKQSVPAKVVWNANEGTSAWEGDLIDALDTVLQQGGLNARWSGNELTVTVDVSSRAEGEQLLGSANVFLPAFLALRLRVFVWIKEFLVEAGPCRFRLETSGHRGGIVVATKEGNEGYVTQAVRDWMMQDEASLRLVMAIYYYRQAERLAELEPDRQSMAAEVGIWPRLSRLSSRRIVIACVPR
jgi:hypothetical protein